MAEPFSVRVVGLNRLRRGLRAMSPELRRGLDRELKAVASPIAADAKRRYRKLHPRRRGGKGSQRGIRATAGGVKSASSSVQPAIHTCSVKSGDHTVAIPNSRASIAMAISFGRRSKPAPMTYSKK